MKKTLLSILSVLLVSALCLSLYGCDKKKDKSDSAAKTEAKVDYDFTALGATMTAGLITDMQENPENYIGKTVRAVGLYRRQTYEETSAVYHYILFTDATGCCYTLGMEYLWKGHDLSEFPEDGAMIAVTGMFGTYDEGSYTYPCFFLDSLKTVNDG